MKVFSSNIKSTRLLLLWCALAPFFSSFLLVEARPRGGGRKRDGGRGGRTTNNDENASLRGGITLADLTTKFATDIVEKHGSNPQWTPEEIYKEIFSEYGQADDAWYETLIEAFDVSCFASYCYTVAFSFSATIVVNDCLLTLAKVFQDRAC